MSPRGILSIVVGASVGTFACAHPRLPEPCGRRTTFCVDAQGTPIRGERNPNLAAGDPLTVVVYDSPNTVEDHVVKLDTGVGSASSLKDYHKGALPFPGPDGSAVLGELHIEHVPASTEVAVNLTISDSSSVTLVQRPFTFGVGAAGYIFEPTFMFPTVFNGRRTVSVSPLPTGRDGTVHTSEDTLRAIDNLSIGINIYPFGGYPPVNCSGPRPLWADVLVNFMPFVCNPAFILRPLALQAGISIANDAFKEYFLGFGYSVVRGMVVSVGAAFVNGQFLSPTLFEGQVVPANTVLSSETKTMIRPYLSVAFSPEILQAALNVLSQAKSIGAVHAGE